MVFLFMLQKASIPFLFTILIFSCKNNITVVTANEPSDSVVSCMMAPPRFGGTIASTDTVRGVDNSEMVLIPSGELLMGGDGKDASEDELPKHTVQIKSFYIDKTEVTNAQFRKFVEATGYITIAERKPDWEELKNSLPPGTERPHDSLMVTASLVFKQTDGPVDLRNYNEWWNWTVGANWRHPQGPASNIDGKDDYPVVHISWYDAMAYCKWAGKRLPTEAEWEWAARGGLKNNIFPWGNEPLQSGKVKANTWDGSFPWRNLQKDGFVRTSPVKTFSPNGYGLFDMAGNVWEWCSDWYDAKYYSNSSATISGPAKSNDPEEPFTPKRVMRGGSFLCNESYCTGYRVARRMKSSPDTGLEHTGFRTVRDIE